MNALQLPLIPIGEQGSGQSLLFLPGVRSDQLDGVDFEVDQEEEILFVHCIYGENEDGEPVGDTYPIAINEFNRNQIDQLDELGVLHPDDVEAEELTDDPEIQEELEGLFEEIKAMEEEIIED